MHRRYAVIILTVLVMGAFVGYRNTNESLDLSKYSVATFAGGCFWCMEAAFEPVDGVVEAISGYSGGWIVDPTYEMVSRGDTGHLEAVRVYYDPDIVSYEELLDVFWRSIDPTDNGGQFYDRGEQYTTAVFYHDEIQKEKALESRDKLAESDRFDKPIVTGVLRFTAFYEAEAYHQDYYKKNVLRYKLYSSGSGRDDFITDHWRE